MTYRVMLADDEPIMRKALLIGSRWNVRLFILRRTDRK